MSIKEFTKSGSFVAVVFAMVVVLLPFAVEQVGEATGLFAFPATKWVKGLFSSGGRKPSAAAAKAVDWNKQLEVLKEFSDWADGKSAVNITIVHPEEFQVDRADPNPAKTARFSWKLRCLSDKLEVSASQVRRRLSLVCEPEDKVSGKIVSVESLSGGEKGFLVTVDNVRGEGKMGLSYEGQVPVYYDVKLRRLWLVPVASCRSAMKDKYDANVFFPGMEKGLPEGAVISPSDDKCGYRILSISDHCVWFEAFYGDKPADDLLPRDIWPDFSRIDTMAPTPPPGRLIFGRSRCFWPNDAIRLPNSGLHLMLDDLIAGKAVVFRILALEGGQLRPIRAGNSELMCVIVREK